jgi:hypothetical protein
LTFALKSIGTLLRYDGEVVGFARPVRIGYTAALERLAREQPLRARALRRFVFAMGLYAIEVSSGRLPGPYEDARAEYFARTFLIDDEAFRRTSTRSDRELAERFGVPGEQIARKRRDVAGEQELAGRSDAISAL